jgi:enoyl-CoA hydratase
VPVRTEIKDRIGEVVLDHPPVNALDSAGWNELAGIVTNVARTRKCGAC